MPGRISAINLFSLLFAVLLPSRCRVQYLNGSTTLCIIFKLSWSSRVRSVVFTSSGSLSSILSWACHYPRFDIFCCSSWMAVYINSSSGLHSRNALSRASTSLCQWVTFSTREQKTVEFGSSCSTLSSKLSLLCGERRIEVHIMWSLPNAQHFLQCNKFFLSSSSASPSPTSIPFFQASESVPHKNPLTWRLIICPK